ncbi:PleD family two-component system response regulator [Pedobacter jeongneungensis]|uniref:response regulator n=1 Tax=Pedobacter jeongneungensis TaxID=947309 RepID=UPI00046A31B6|nr:response regulator [Pedobacter jeongneungensis]
MSKILILEDYYSNAEMIADLFSGEGHQVSILSSGEGFMQKALFFHPDLVIMDIKLDGYDGRDFCNAMAANAQLKSIPVVTISAILESELKDIPYHPAYHYSKPFDINKLYHDAMKIIH